MANQYKRLLVFLGPQNAASFDCTEIQFTGTVLSVIKDKEVIGQFNMWQAWSWMLGDQNGEKKTELASVTSIDAARKPADAPSDGTPPTGTA